MNTELSQNNPINTNYIENLHEFSMAVIYKDNGIDSLSFSRVNHNSGISGVLFAILDGLGVGECAIIHNPRMGGGEWIGDNDVYSSGIFSHISYGLQSWKDTPQREILAVCVRRNSVAEYHSTNKRLGDKNNRWHYVQLSLLDDNTRLTLKGVKEYHPSNKHQHSF